MREAGDKGSRKQAGNTTCRTAAAAAAAAANGSSAAAVCSKKTGLANWHIPGTKSICTLVCTYLRIRYTRIVHTLDFTDGSYTHSKYWCILVIRTWCTIPVRYTDG